MGLGIVIYVFGIALVQTLKGSDVGADYFSSVMHAATTLLLRGTFLDGISSLMADIEGESWLGMTLMYLFIVIGAVTIMNMLIGVLCEVITAVAGAEKEAIQVNWVKDTLSKILSIGTDMNNDGLLQRSEFIALLSNREAIATLRGVDVDVCMLVDCAEVIFDGNNNEGDEQVIQAEIGISLVDFTEMILQLRGSNTATVKDMVELRKTLNLRFKAIEEKIVSTSRASLRAFSAERLTHSLSEIGQLGTPTLTSHL